MPRLAGVVVAFVLVSGCARWHPNEIKIAEEPQDLPFATQWINLRHDLRDICFSGDIGWAVGRGGLLLKTEDGGRSWLPEPAPASRALEDPRIFFFDRAHGVIVGTDQIRTDQASTVILSTSDGGKQWKSHSIKPADRRPDYSFSDTAFAGERTAWIADFAGLYRTTDGGALWELINATTFQAIAFISPNVGWAAEGSRIYHTRDGGRTWTTRAELGEVTVLQFVDEQFGWAGTFEKLYRTEDGGATWSEAPTLPDFLFSIRFLDRMNGFTLGRGIQRTDDGGRTWTMVYAGDSDLSVRSSLRAISVNGRRVFIALTEGRIMEFEHAVNSWRDLTPDWSDIKTLARGQPVLNDRLNDVPSPLVEQLESLTPDGSIKRVLQKGKTIWAAGTQGHFVTVYTSHDDGERRSFEQLGIGTPVSMHLLSGRRLVLYVDDETYVGFPVNTAPWVEHFALDGNVLQWRAKDAEGDAIVRASLSFSPRTATNFGPLDVNVERTGPGSFRARLKPIDAVNPWEKSHFRINLRDARGLQFAHQLPEAVTYMPWLAGAPPVLRWILLSAGAFTAYWLLATLLLFTAPLTFVRIDARLPPALLAPQGPPGVKFGLALASALIGIDYFLRRGRVVHAWLALFRTDAGRLASLSPSTRAAFLGRDDVRAAWIEHYREGRVVLAELPAAARERCVDDPAFLDAWVSRRIDAASEAFGTLELVRQRRVHVSLPVRIVATEGERLLPSPSNADLIGLFARDRSVIEIVGEGGVGKSALAVHIGELLLAGGTGFRSLPVILQEEINDIAAQVTGALREAVGGDDLESDVVLSLLARKRVVVIFDSLSERGEATRRNVAALHRSVAVNAIVVTTRSVLQFGGVPITQVLPQKVGIDNVVYFMTEYLNQTGRALLFTRREPLHLGDRILALMEAGGQAQAVTPLFLTIFLEQACHLQEHGMALEALPTSVPEMVLEDIRRTNPKEGPDRIGDEALVAAAKVLGSVSLGERFVPGDFLERTAQAALTEGGAANGVLARLESNGVLVRRERGGTRIYRFSLDPVAEYLAALRLVDRLGADAAAWSNWLHQLAELPERGSAKGFVAALTNVVFAYETEFGIPSLVRTALASSDRLDDLQPCSGETLQTRGAEGGQDLRPGLADSLPAGGGLATST